MALRSGTHVKKVEALQRLQHETDFNPGVVRNLDLHGPEIRRCPALEPGSNNQLGFEGNVADEDGNGKTEATAADPGCEDDSRGLRVDLGCCFAERGNE
jgi:hypothetical protein